MSIKYIVVNRCDSHESITGQQGEPCETFDLAKGEALRLAIEFKEREGIEADPEVTDEAVSLDYRGCIHYWEVVEVNLPEDGLTELVRRLMEEGHIFQYTPVKMGLRHNGAQYAAKVVGVDYLGNHRHSVLWCPAHGVFVDVATGAEVDVEGIIRDWKYLID